MGPQDGAQVPDLDLIINKNYLSWFSKKKKNQFRNYVEMQRFWLVFYKIFN